MNFPSWSRTPPLGWTAPRDTRSKGMTLRPLPQKNASPAPTVILSPTTRPLRVAVRTGLLDASMTPSQSGTACAVAVHAEWRIKNLGGGIAAPMPPDLPVRSLTPQGRAAHERCHAQWEMRGESARDLKGSLVRQRQRHAPRGTQHLRTSMGDTYLKQSAVPTIGMRVTTATGVDASQRRIENTMFKEAGPDSDRRIGGENGVVKARVNRNFVIECVKILYSKDQSGFHYDAAQCQSASDCRAKTTSH